ncbi:thiamine phosphate synthase [bacterium endosymbiont of Pedicinus badii]|uniref:thiamine phosphate synthase n=1 Tax=bacterium endosymbiont of Pedicinus badii TaxID=1719126 RepID=UPI0009BB5618|nr:thiamine phosphate synthase [bacterium endosymbiont of Pedicinus badii]OQM34035.1 hypothetical protein AOQ89_01585 [bacterium endosymbiont of Pedicinus badii]
MNNKKKFSKFIKNKIFLYPIVDSLFWLVKVLDFGIKFIQFRIKNFFNYEKLCFSIEAAIILGKKYNAFIFINDYWKLAIKYQAFGIHLGQEDIKSIDIKKIQKHNICFGISAHSKDEFKNAVRFSPDYISLGHVFYTNTKIMKNPPIGLEMVKKIQREFSSSIPIIAIGGINSTNIKKVLSCSINAIAISSFITENPVWKKSIVELRNKYPLLF